MCTPQAIVQAVKDAGAFFCHYKVNSSFDSSNSDEDGDDLLSMSISLFISGGDDIQIAKAIYNSKPLGIGLNGDFRVDVTGTGNDTRWFNLNYTDYSLQKKAERKANRTLEKEYLFKRLGELEEEE